MFAQRLLAAVFCALLLGQEGGAPVIIDGKEVVRVYGSGGTFSPQGRAPEIKRRIEALAEKVFSGNITMRPIATENATALVAGQIIVMIVTDLDAKTAGIAREELAGRNASAIQKAIYDYRRQHTFLNFLYAILKT